MRPGIFLAGTFFSQHGGARAPIEDLAAKFREHGYTLATASSVRNRWLRVPHLFLAAAGRRRSFDLAIIDLYSGPAYLWGSGLSAALRWLNCPVILALHGGSLPDYARQYPQAVRRRLQSVAAVVAPSPYLVEQMKPYRSDIRLVPNPVPVESFQFRHRTQIRPRLVWVRGFHSMYNPQMAVSVLQLLKAAQPDAHLIMVGGRRGDQSLECTRELARSGGLGESVSFLGPRPRTEIPGVLQNGDVFLNTTNVDNTPVSVLEAMSCGLCIVSTNVGGIPYLLEHQNDALLVPPGDARAMADAVLRLAREPELAARLSANARKKAESFGWSSIFPLWEDLVYSVAVKGGAACLSISRY